MKIFGKTEQQAKNNGMHKEQNIYLYCPECGCPWYGNKNLCGEGHRVCYDCHQDWYVDVEYNTLIERRELPKS